LTRQTLKSREKERKNCVFDYPVINPAFVRARYSSYYNALSVQYYVVQNYLSCNGLVRISCCVSFRLRLLLRW